MAQRLSQDELQKILAWTVQLAREGGEIMLRGSEAMRKSAQTEEKKNSVDLVTEFDVAVEELVKTRIGESYPTFKFIGEETYAKHGRTEVTDEPTFCVDPIDGTTNFVHGFPHTCISIGLISYKRPVLGVIYNPFLDQLYTATKGGGAFLAQGGRPPVKLPLASPPLPLPNLSQALIGIEWGSDRAKDITEKKGESFKRLSGDPKTGVERGQMAHSLRSLGSAALNYGLVAQGGLDMYWEIGTWPWDICAGAIICQEAGCLVTGPPGHPMDNEVTPELLWGRKHMVIRAIGDTEVPGIGRVPGAEQQKRLVEEFYKTVEDFEPAK